VVRKRLVRIAAIVAAGIHVDHCDVELRDLVKQPMPHVLGDPVPVGDAHVAVNRDRERRSDGMPDPAHPHLREGPDLGVVPHDPLHCIHELGLHGVHNEAIALYRIRVGREIGSAALVADGPHARTDGLTSLAVVAVGVWLGYPIADPLVGLLITVAILFVLKQVLRYQEEQRAQMARERMARAASVVHATGRSRARRVGSPGLHGPWAALRQLLHPGAGTHRIAWHRAR
jgi:Cation efflux family